MRRFVIVKLKNGALQRPATAGWRKLAAIRDLTGARAIAGVVARLGGGRATSKRPTACDLQPAARFDRLTARASKRRRQAVGSPTYGRSTTGFIS